MKNKSERQRVIEESYARSEELKLEYNHHLHGTDFDKVFAVNEALYREALKRFLVGWGHVKTDSLSELESLSTHYEIFLKTNYGAKSRIYCAFNRLSETLDAVEVKSGGEGK
jgi:hypothetical protein